MFKKEKKEDIVSILNKNIIILKEINRARKKIEVLEKTKKLVDHNLNFKDDLISRAYEGYKKRFEKPQLNDLILIFLKHMEEFEFWRYTSVPQKFDVQYRENESMFLKLGKVNLRDHSLRVFMIACDLNRNSPDKFSEEIALLSLTHDFGKCNKIIDFVGSSPKETHNQVSANYVQIIMRQLRYPQKYINLFYETLFYHHMKDEKVLSKNTFYIQSLNECDYRARKQEEQEIEQKRIQNIKKVAL